MLRLSSRKRSGQSTSSSSSRIASRQKTTRCSATTTTANTDPEQGDGEPQDGQPQSGQKSSKSKSRSDAYKDIEKELNESASKSDESDASQSADDAADGESGDQEGEGGSKPSQRKPQQSGKSGGTNDPKDADAADGKNAKTDVKDGAKDAKTDKDGKDAASVKKDAPKKRKTLAELSKGDRRAEEERAAKQIEAMRDAAKKSIRNDYEERARRQSRQIDVLQAHIATAYIKDMMPKIDPIPVRSGPRWNMQRALASRFRYQATGTYDDRVYNRRTQPTKRDVEFVFVLDRSASTVGVMNLFKDALVQCMEAAQLEKIKVGLVVFSDTAAKYPFDANGQDHQTSVDLIDSFSGGSGTNDVAGLTCGVEMLSESKAAQRVIIVITDGEGKKDEQRALLARCADPKDINMDVYGVGVGAGMQAVAGGHVNRGSSRDARSARRPSSASSWSRLSPRNETSVDELLEFAAQLHVLGESAVVFGARLDGAAAVIPSVTALAVARSSTRRSTTRTLPGTLWWTGPLPTTCALSFIRTAVRAHISATACVFGSKHAAIGSYRRASWCAATSVAAASSATASFATAFPSRCGSEVMINRPHNVFARSGKRSAPQPL